MSRSAGIPTAYKGINYRSRLEARWGWVFDGACEGRVVYEPFDADGYIPDFLTYPHPGLPILVEVKPVSKLDEYAEVLDDAIHRLGQHWTHGVGVVGLSPMTPCFMLWRQEGRHDYEQMSAPAWIEDEEFGWPRACNETQWRAVK